MAYFYQVLLHVESTKELALTRFGELLTRDVAVTVKDHVPGFFPGIQETARLQVRVVRANRGIHDRKAKP